MLPVNLKGTRLPALERNVLKYRALEMVMVLFRSEELKRFVLNTIQTTDRSRKRFDTTTKERIPLDAAKVYKKAWAALVADEILTQSESNEVQSLIDYRNTIAHRVQSLTGDISGGQLARDFRKLWGVRYDYNALKKLKHYHAKIERGFLSKGYVFLATLEGIGFEAAEKTYEDELRHLGRKIDRQLAVRKEDIEKLNAEMSGEDSEFLRHVEPYHPENIAPNGTLTERGVETCYRLFDHNKSISAVAHLMRISYRAAARRHRAWEKESGHSRHLEER